MRNLLYLSGLFLLCTSCGSEQTKSSDRDEFVSETTFVTDAYPPLDEKCMKIMDELQICTLTDTILDRPPCSNKFFRVFDYRPNKEWEEGFIVEMVPGLYGSPGGY